MKRIVSIVLVLVLCLGLCACDEGEPRSSRPKKSKQPNCATCLDYVVGKWYRFTPDGALERREYREDGTYLFNDERGTWECACDGDYKAISVTDEDGICYGDTWYNPAGETFNDCLRDEGYTFVELTTDNWQEYFSENFNEVFEITYDLIVEEHKNDWGEVTDVSYGVQKRARFKNTARFAPLMRITLEFDCGYAYEVAAIDAATHTLVDIRLDEELHLEKHTATTAFVTAEDGGYTALDLGMDDREGLGDNSCISVSLQTPGEKIYRMKGWLVLK